METMVAKKALTLSLIIPAYNEEDHLRKCLASVAAQTLKPFEVIVVDNDSSDKTKEVAASFSSVRVISEKRHGVVYARNAGFDAAKGEIIGRIDADTVLPADWVERVLEFFANEDNLNHALTGGCYFYNVPFKRFCSWWQGQIAFRANRLLLGHYIVFGSNMAMPSQLWKGVRSNTCSRTDVHEDLDLAIHLHRQGYKITYRETLKVGVKMRRVFEDRKELWSNLKWWPQTLRVHGIRTWIIGYIGAVILYGVSTLALILRPLRRR